MWISFRPISKLFPRTNISAMIISADLYWYLFGCGRTGKQSSCQDILKVKQLISCFHFLMYCSLCFSFPTFYASLLPMWCLWDTDLFFVYWTVIATHTTWHVKTHISASQMSFVYVGCMRSWLSLWAFQFFWNFGNVCIIRSCYQCTVSWHY